MLRERTPVRKGADDGQACAGCGTEGIDLSARLCPVCGKLISEGFRPLDAIRSSYGLQRKYLAVKESENVERLFRSDRNAISDAAWACTVYSMVPYLGILFIPIAIAVGGFGYLTARETADDDGGRRTALRAVALSLVLLVVQLVFWWLLYLIPEIGL